MAKTARYDDGKDVEAVSSSFCEEQKDLSDASGSESGEDGGKGEADGEVDEEEIEAVTTGAGADEQADGGAAAVGGEEDEEEPESTDYDEVAYLFIDRRRVTAWDYIHHRPCALRHGCECWSRQIKGLLIPKYKGLTLRDDVCNRCGACRSPQPCLVFDAGDDAGDDART